MKFFLKLFSAIFVAIALLYLLLFWSFSIKIKELNLTNKRTIFLEATKSKIDFEEIIPHISFFSIGVKITGMSEKIKNNQIYHQAPLYIVFNPFTFKISGNYKGESLVSNNLDSADSQVVDSDICLTFNMYLDFKTLIFLLKNKPIKLLNHIKNITLEYKKLNVYSKKLLGNIFQANNTKFTLITKHDTYKNISDINSNLPKFYSLSGIVNIENSKNIRNLAPFSIIYGIIPNFDMKGAFFIEIDSAEKKFDINKPFDNAKTRFICNKCTSSKIDIDINSKFDSISEDIKVDLSSEIKLKQAFFTDMPLWFNAVIKEIDSFDHEASVILRSPNKYLPPIDYSNKYTVKTNSILNIKDHYVEANIYSLILRSSSGAGLMLNGKGDLNSELNFNLDGKIFLTHADSLIKYWVEYFYKNIKHMGESEKDIIDFNNQVISSTAKEISEFPTSESKDFMYTVLFNSKENKFLVCNKPLTDLTITYFRIKTKILLDKASESNNPLQYILRVTPELDGVAGELIKQLPKKTKVSNELWQKLTE